MPLARRPLHTHPPPRSSLTPFPEPLPRHSPSWRPLLSTCQRTPPGARSRPPLSDQPLQGFPSPGAWGDPGGAGSAMRVCVSAGVSTCWPSWLCAAWAAGGTTASCSAPRTCWAQAAPTLRGAARSSRRSRCPPPWTCSSPVSSAPGRSRADLRGRCRRRGLSHCPPGLSPAPGAQGGAPCPALPKPKSRNFHPQPHVAAGPEGTAVREASQASAGECSVPAEAPPQCERETQRLKK